MVYFLVFSSCSIALAHSCSAYDTDSVEREQKHPEKRRRGFVVQLYIPMIIPVISYRLIEFLIPGIEFFFQLNIHSVAIDPSKLYNCEWLSN